MDKKPYPKRYVRPTIKNVELPPKAEGGKRSPEEAFALAREIINRERAQAKKGNESAADES